MVTPTLVHACSQIGGNQYIIGEDVFTLSCLLPVKDLQSTVELELHGQLQEEET
jgi:hypothetical protein